MKDKIVEAVGGKRKSDRTEGVVLTVKNKDELKLQDGIYWVGFDKIVD